MVFTPDYRNLVDAANNIHPKRMPLYEHVINSGIISACLGEKVELLAKRSEQDVHHYMDQLCRFYKKMTYDTVSWEGGVCRILPGGGAIMGGKAGPIQNRSDFEKYPWNDLERLYWEYYTPYFEGLRKAMPEGMKAVGGVGNGVFELSEDLVGYEWLCLMQYDDPELFRDLFVKIGDLLVSLWKRLLTEQGDLFCVCRMGDDLGFKSNTLLSPDTIREHVVPQYRRIIDTVHAAGKPFLLHSCGNIFSVMDDILDAGINAKHSNEDQIAVFDEWIEKYGDRIGLFGGVDVNDLCLLKPEEVRTKVTAQIKRFREKAKGFALGSGNSIPDYVPVDCYRAMIDAANEARR